MYAFLSPVHFYSETIEFNRTQGMLLYLFRRLHSNIPFHDPFRREKLGCTCEAWSHAGRVTRVSFSWLLLFVLWYVDLVSRSTRTPSNQNSKVLWSQNMWPKAALHVLGPLHKITIHESWQILQWPRDMQCLERLEKEHHIHRIDDMQCWRVCWFFVVISRRGAIR